jgi:hypothetical protein
MLKVEASNLLWLLAFGTQIPHRVFQWQIILVGLVHFIFIIILWLVGDDGELTHNNNNRAIRGGNKIPQTCKNLWGPTHAQIKGSQ